MLAEWIDHIKEVAMSESLMLDRTEWRVAPVASLMGRRVVTSELWHPSRDNLVDCECGLASCMWSDERR